MSTPAIAAIVLGIPAFASIGCLLASVIAAVTKRWALTRRIARLSCACAGWFLVVLPVFLLWTVTSAAGDGADALPKATVLGQGISAAMNYGALSLPSLVLSLVMWRTAARRLRVPDARAEPSR